MSEQISSKAWPRRIQHLFPAAMVLMLAAAVTWLSYTREPSDAFLFPRLISSVMIVLAIWNFVRAALGLAKVGDGIEGKTILRILPGVVVMIVLIYFAAKSLGFYVASFLAFLCAYSLYDPASHAAPRSWIKRLIITAVFMAVIYALFTVLLKVQTPRGHYF